jgi:hypothetical protein
MTVTNDLHREVHFEKYLTQMLSDLNGSGWRVSNTDEGFDPQTALYWPDFIEFQRATIICQNNFRHSFSLTWSGKTCDIRRSL